MHANLTIHEAAKFNKIEELKTLVTNPENLNLKDQYEFTPLHYACRACHVESIKLLLESGAEPNCFTKNGYGPVDFVIGNINMSDRCRAEIVEIMCSHGATLDEDRKGFKSAMHMYSISLKFNPLLFGVLLKYIIKRT